MKTFFLVFAPDFFVERHGIKIFSFQSNRNMSPENLFFNQQCALYSDAFLARSCFAIEIFFAFLFQFDSTNLLLSSILFHLGWLDVSVGFIVISMHLGHSYRRFSLLTVAVMASTFRGWRFFRVY